MRTNGARFRFVMNEGDGAARPWSGQGHLRRFLMAGAMTLGAVMALVLSSVTALAAPNAWQTVASLPHATYNLAAVGLSNGLVIALGGDDGNNTLSTVIEYDPSNNKWSGLASMSTARTLPGAAVGTDGRVYALGGYNLDSGSLSSAEVYTPSTNKWSGIASMPGARTHMAAAGGRNGHIYVFGGMDGSDAVVNTTFDYNPATNSWSTVTPMPSGRDDAAAAVGSDGRIYVAGGFYDGNYSACPVVCANVDAYDPSTNTWSTVAPMPTARFGLTMVAANDGRLYAIGGSGNSGILNTVEGYDPSSDTWSTEAPMPTARLNLGGALGSSGVIYAIGGRVTQDDLTKVVEAYTPPTDTATTVGSQLNPTVVGQQVTYTAHVSPIPDGGSVSFYEDGSSTPMSCGSGSVALLFGAATCKQMYSNAGTHTIRAKYSGDSSYLDSVSGSLTQHINQASTTTALSVNTTPSTVGQAITFLAHVSVSSPGTGNPTGSVEFADNGHALTCTGGSQTLDASGMASCADTFGSAGAHSITARYSGDDNFATSASSALAQQVNQAQTATSLSAQPNPADVGQVVTFTAQISVQAPGAGSPTGSVSFYQDGSATALSCGSGSSQSVNAQGQATCTVSYSGAGSHTVTASYGGDGNFAGSSSSAVTQTINQEATNTTLSSQPNPSIVGQQVTYTAHVSPIPDGGSVSFYEDGSSTSITCGSGSQALASGTATCTQTYSSVGSHSVTATYSGDAGFAGSTSSALTQQVNQASTSTSLSAQPNPSVVGQAVTYTAQVSTQATGVGTPTGSVSFYQDASSTPMSCGSDSNQSLDGQGQATCTLSYSSIGSHSITAHYGGDATFAGSVADALTQHINQASTTTALSVNTTPSTVGQAITFLAHVSVSSPGAGNPTGSVEFADNGQALTCTGGSQTLDASGMASCADTFGSAGAHSITARYSGDDNFATSASSALAQQVNQAQTATAVSSDKTPVVGQSVTFSAAVSVAAPGSGSPTGTVTFEEVKSDGTGGTPLSCGSNGSVSLDAEDTAACTASFNTAGDHFIRASYEGDDNFSASASTDSGQQPLDQKVTQAATNTALSSSVNPSVTGQAITLTAHVTVQSPGAGAPTGSVTFSDNGGPMSCSSGAATLSTDGTATCTLTYSATGSHTISASYSGDTNFKASSTASALTQEVDTNLSGYPTLPNGADNLSSSNLKSAYLVNANLSKADASNANLMNANLSGTTLMGANLNSSNLIGANLTGANLTGASLSNSNLKGANLTGANLSGATGMASANLSGVTWSNTTCPDGSNSNGNSNTCLGHL